ncbi:hypothetical protein F5Y10DRAFT_9991 [Nemania abortiva]|nr:hypothetical protein F5Y10DRAFT_9991 [Nemania abortiva]
MIDMDITADLKQLQRQALSCTGRNRLDEAFRAALSSFRQHAPAGISDKIGQWTTVEDVICQIRIAEAKYSSRPSGKAWKWVVRLSEKIMFYSQVLDALAQHHPEYVSLAWGAIKFTFIGVINHETLIKELTKAMVRISDVIKHVQVQYFLYPTDEVIEYMSEIYSHIMSFAIRAVDWYQKGKIAHSLAAFTSPFQLKFRDIVDNISETSHNIDRWATTMSHMEIRRMRQQLIETGKALEGVHQVVAELKGVVLHYSQLHYTGVLDTNQRLSEIQFSQILSFISVSPIPRPDLVRQSYNARRNRRRQASSGVTGSQLWVSKLYHWGKKPNSSQIVVQGNFKARHTTRDFTANVIDLIKEANIPVVWVLDPRVELLAESQFNTTDVLKYLACQVLRLNNRMSTERQVSLNAGRFQSAVTESEWLELLVSVMQGLNQIYLIVDMDLVERGGGATTEWLLHLASLGETLRLRNMQTVVKVACICTNRCSVTSLPPETESIRLDAMKCDVTKRRTGKIKRRKQQTDRGKLLSAIKEGADKRNARPSTLDSS